MSQFQNIKIKSKAGIKQQDCCNKHHDKKGEYFELQCPWIKFCQICALNIALCGKKIQKDLNSSQMFNKINLSEILKQMQKSVKDSQNQHTQYNFLIKQTQNIRDYFGNIIIKIQSFIQKLSFYKSQLQQILYDNITKQLMCLFDKQNLLNNKKAELNNNINKIQCEFTKLLKDSNQNIMNNHVRSCRQKLLQCQELFLNQNYQRQLINKINEIKKKFQNNLQLINQSRITIEFVSLKSKFTQNYHQIDTFNEESTIYCVDGRQLYTQPNNTDVSGLVSRAETINNETKLIELNGNRRNSRAVLQLRARCNTKSAKKIDRQRIQIDVRQSIKENISRVKAKA